MPSPLEPSRDRARAPVHRNARGADRQAQEGSFDPSIRELLAPIEPVPNRPASHGCVRITDPSINELFDRLVVGTPVVVY
jgi:hypothetical protein